MIDNKTTEASKWVVKPVTAILTALHVLLIIFSLVVHPPIEMSAVRALP